jgi:hypothetical protein
MSLLSSPYLPSCASCQRDIDLWSRAVPMYLQGSLVTVSGTVTYKQHDRNGRHQPFSSNTGVSMVMPPWRSFVRQPSPWQEFARPYILKTSVMVLKIFSLSTMSGPDPRRAIRIVPRGRQGFLAATHSLGCPWGFYIGLAVRYASWDNGSRFGEGRQT